MKKLMLVGLVCLGQIATVSAAGAEELACPASGREVRQIGKVVAWCVDGKKRYAGIVGEVPIVVTARLLKTDKPENSITLSTTDGKPTTYSVGKKVGFPTVKNGAVVTDFVDDGFVFAAVPLLGPNGTVSLELFAARSKLLGFEPARVGGFDHKAPVVETLLVDRRLEGLEPGKEVSIPLVAAGQSGASEYVLVVSAKRI